MARAVVLSEIRIESLGAISTATAEFDRGLTVLTGETGTEVLLRAPVPRWRWGPLSKAGSAQPTSPMKSLLRSTRFSTRPERIATKTAASSPHDRSAAMARPGHTSVAAAFPRSH